MAFAYAVSGSTVAGNKRLAYGTFTNGAGDVGGDVVTGLDVIDWIGFNVTSHSGSTEIKTTISGGTVTIEVPNSIIPSTQATDGVDGTWMAIGN